MNLIVIAARCVLRTIWLLFLLLLVLFPVLFWVNVHRRSGEQQSYLKAEKASRWMASRLLAVFSIKVCITGSPAQGPVLIAANHISWLDILVLHSVRSVGFVGKAEIERWPIFSFMARTGGTIFHQRGSAESANDVNTVMIGRLKLGQRVAIFPEGGVLPGNAIRKFHARMFRAAVDVGCPVQPVMVRYMLKGSRDDGISFRREESMMANVGRLLAHPGAEADLRYFSPMEAKGMPRRVLAETSRDLIVASYEE